MKPQPCFETNKTLEEAARHAEARKNQAIDRLMGKLGPRGGFEEAITDLIDADKRVLQETGR
jgi:hypothetical protein